MPAGDSPTLKTRRNCAFVICNAALPVDDREAIGERAENCLHCAFALLRASFRFAETLGQLSPG